MKILGFDSWTRGSHHFDRLVPAFEAKSMSLSLVHLGSWGNEPGRPDREECGRLSVRDIRSYRHHSLDSILAEENPDAVIFLSTETFAHRAFNRFCLRRGIPTLNLYHGLVAVQVIDNPRGSYEVNRWAYARYMLSKLRKTFRRTLPCYASALLGTRASVHDWGRFLTDVVWMVAGRTRLVAADDARTTRCCVYTQADVEHAISTYGFAASDVMPVGNPDLMRFGLKQEMIGSRVACLDSEKREIMYINTGLVASGVILKSREEFIKHLVQTADSLASQGMKMLFKPHPSDDGKFLAEQLRGSKIELVAKDAFLTRLEDCAACIVETTTLAIVPALMGMPLFYANYGVLKALRFGPVLTSYPRGYMLENVSGVGALLRRDAANLVLEALREWIAFNAGPLPAEEMPHRVAEVVTSMIQDTAPFQNAPIPLKT